MGTFFFHFALFFLVKISSFSYQKKREKNNLATARLSAISATHYTGNKLFFKGGLTYHRTCRSGVPASCSYKCGRYSEFYQGSPSLQLMNSDNIQIGAHFFGSRRFFPWEPSVSPANCKGDKKGQRTVTLYREAVWKQGVGRTLILDKGACNLSAMFVYLQLHLQLHHVSVP